MGNPEVNFPIADYPLGIARTENHFFDCWFEVNVVPKKSLLFHVGRRSCCATS
jgi:hypothetical protein